MGNADSAPLAMVEEATKKQHKVQLVATAISPFVPTMPQAFHTSVVVDAMEYSFSRRGIVSARNYQSHLHLAGPGKVLEMGTTSFAGPQMVKALRSHFREQSYDLLRKNCNSFSDCALFFLLGRRLDSKYCELEQIGTSADRHIGLVRMLSLGDYAPNPKADGFRVDDVIEALGAGSGDDKENAGRKYKPGQHLQVLSNMHKGWVNATVRAVHPSGTITVLYEGGHHQKDVPIGDLAKVLRPKRG